MQILGIREFFDSDLFDTYHKGALIQTSIPNFSLFDTTVQEFPIKLFDFFGDFSIRTSEGKKPKI